MNWQEICEHPSLQNLPFKIELNEHGEIIMNAVRVTDSLYQGEIEFLLRSLLKKGKTLPECAIKTSKGTKVADVAWASPDILRIIKHETECSIAPEICVEVLSSSNTNDEMLEKRHLYFEAKAKEVWICKEGKMYFYNISGQLVNSLLVPLFPVKVEVDV
jgi:Uma2 family endonuclease